MNNVSNQDSELFNNSYERCMVNPRHPGFLNRFYQIFLGSSPEIAEKFQRTDFRKQIQVLKSSLYFLMLASTGMPEGIVHLEHIAQLHSRAQLDVRPDMYDLWLACLLQAVHEYDASLDAETELAWQRVLQHGIDFMKAKY